MKKTLSFMLAVLMIASGISFAVPVASLTPYYVGTPSEPSTAYKNSVYYERLCAIELTGNQIEDLIAVAESQLGYHEGNSNADLGGTNTNGSDNYTEYGYWWDGNAKHQWCAGFVVWCARQAGISTDIIRGSLVASYESNYLNVAFTARDKATPKRGDLIFFDWADDGRDGNSDHVGIVINNDGTNVTFIDGNSGENCVRTKSYTLTNANILGYGRPKYESKDVITYKIDTLSSLLDEKYFTTTGKSLSKDKADECAVANVVKSEWFTDLFDDHVSVPIPTSSFAVAYNVSDSKDNPTHGSLGYSCFGFANFAFWYIFHEGEKKVETEYVVTYKEDNTAKFNYETIEKYARPGDIIRIYSSKTGNGHSVIFVSHSETGMKVLDSNFWQDNKVDLHEIRYDRTSTGMDDWSDCQIAITRAANYDEIAGTTSGTTSTYTISYNANGGSNPPKAQTKTHGVALTLSSTKPTRTGYTFKGWATSSTGAVAYDPGESFAANANTVLYAVWEANSTQSGEGYSTQYRYSRYLNTEGATGKHYNNGARCLPYYTASCCEGPFYTDWMDTPYPVKKDYGSYLSYGKNGTYDSQGLEWYNQETRLVPNNYTVTFNANGGTTPTASKSVTYGLTYGTLPTPTRTGYTFAGWYTAASGGTKITSSSTVSITAAQTLYAHWTPQIYTVTLNPTGGTLLLTSKQVTYGSTYGTLPNPDRPGYIFDGWYTSASGGTKITSETVVSITANQTLYARWVARTFSIIYDANGGTNAPASQTKTFDVVLKLTDAAPTRTGYTFKGWALSASRTDVSYSPGGNFSTNKDTTLYAVWNANKYTVTFNANGGTTPTASKAVTYASTYGTLPTPNYEGYTFDGWYTAKTGGTKVTSSTAVSITANQTLYAHWTTNSYTIEFDATGGTTPTASKDVTFGSTYGTLPTPTRTGYTFAGWYTAKSGGKEITSTSTVEAPGNHTLYANWKANTYTITLDPNDGFESYTQTVTFGSPYGDAVTNMTAECYKFDGWYTEKTGGTEVTVETIVSTASNHTLYARWIPIAATNIYFDEETIEIDIGENYALWLYVEPKNCGEEITFEASSSSITYEYEYLRENSNASVYQIVISAKTVGTYNFKATVGNKTTNCTVKVNSSAVYVTGVSLNKTTATMTKGETLTLTATVAPTNATNKNVTWSSSNTSVATVSNGVVTAKSAGTATITVKTEDGSKTASCTITVKEAVDPNVLTFSVESVKATAGKTVKININITNNPGIAGLSFFVGYDSSVMSLKEYECPSWEAVSSSFSEDLTNNPVGFSWSRTSNYNSNGVLISLTFEIKKNAPTGEYDITLTTNDVVTNSSDKDIDFELMGGKISIVKGVPGDSNGDGAVNSKDAVRLAQYLAGWKVSMEMSSADCNGDGAVNSKDAVRLAQYLAGWKVELK